MDGDPTQAAPIAILSEPIAASSRFDLRDYTLEQAANARVVGRADCASGESTEIVVCAPDQHRFRLKADAVTSGRTLPKAEFKLSDRATVLTEVEAASLLQGVQSNRVMMRLKLGF